MTQTERQTKVNSQNNQKGFLFDPNKCTGCNACQLACAIENEVELANSWRGVFTFNEFRFPGMPQFHLSLACNHCIEPACLKFCPVLAYSKDNQTGAVMLDQGKCIGCGYCNWVCPYDAPKYNSQTRVMEKCTFCQHRLQEGIDPACVALCPTTALRLIDFNPATCTSIPGFTETNIQPAIQFVPLKQKNVISTQAAVHDGKNLLTGLIENPAPKITLKKEWTLVIFTLIVAFLVGWFSARTFLQTTLKPIVFLATGSSAIFLSLFHLGKPLRAFCAIFNLRKSWLSREIFLFTLFLFLAFLSWFFPNPAIKWVTTTTGIFALFAIDRLYQVATRANLQLHSARTLFSGALFMGLMAGSKELLVGILAIKLLFYGYRKLNFKKGLFGTNPLLTIARFLPGLAAILFFNSNTVFAQLTVYSSIIIGEIIDRSEFYLKLDIPTPQKQINLDFAKWK